MAARTSLGLWPSSTRRAISARMAREAATSESATDWLPHIGHLRVRAIASTCSSVVRGGPSSNAARPSDTTPSAAITIQLPRRKPGLREPAHGPVRRPRRTAMSVVERGPGDRAGEPLHDGAVRAR